MDHAGSITTLYLMIHPEPRSQAKVDTYLPRWRAFLGDAGRNSQAVLCLITNASPLTPVIHALAQESFGQRCFVDCRDWSDPVKLKYVDHVCRTFAGHGKHCGAYGLWSDRLALIWSEGLRGELAARGLHMDPTQVQVIGFGSQWGGCLTKYVALMSSNLGVKATPEILPHLCHDAGHRLRADFLEKKHLDEHVWCYLFRTAGGVHFAQFMDSLRAVWEPPKTVSVATDPGYLYNVRVTGPQPPQSPVTMSDGRATFAVMDGYLSPTITVLDPKGTYESFRMAMFAAVVGRSDPLACRSVSFGAFPHEQEVDLGGFD